MNCYYRSGSMLLLITIFKRKYKSHIYFFVLILFTLMTTGMGLLGGESSWPDESRHAMDGVYFVDIMKDLPFSNLYNYTEQYYAKYPALSLAWYPPLFAITEAIFYSLFGISIYTARLTVVFFALLGVSIWYMLVRKIYNREVAFYSGLLFISTPLIFYWSHSVMLEIPTLAMILLCFFCFYNYFELFKKKYAYYLALSISGALLTKQIAAFILPVFLSYILIGKKYKMLIKQECIISYFILALFLIPLIGFNINFGTLGISATVGEFSGKIKGDIVEQWIHYLRYLPNNIITWPVLLLAVVSIVFILIKKNDKGKSLLFFLWIFWWYICFSYISGSVREIVQYGEYYGILVIPPFCLFAVLSLNALKNRLRNTLLNKFIPFFVFIAIIIYQITLSYNAKIYYLPNVYEKAAKFVCQSPKGLTTFVCANYDGNFIFHLKKYDVDRKMIVLRADKIFVSLAVHEKYGVIPHISDENEIHNILKKYCTGYIIVEDKILGELINIKAIEMFRNILDSGHFTLIRHIKSEDNVVNNKFGFFHQRIRDISIKIYEYNNRSSPQPDDELVIPFPHMGREIRIPLKVIVDN
ncbi:MAG: glycosyltransferase family 39 protein [Candidatus Delongbacteria bacterium]|nr:glycosyltransferase family 39 protein [Candidatus Delongbacteria bacterium]